MARLNKLASGVAAFSCFWMTAAGALAQTVEDFYKSKPLTIVVGVPTGGG